jgi:hypothetical protein
MARFSEQALTMRVWRDRLWLQSCFNIATVAMGPAFAGTTPERILHGAAHVIHALRQKNNFI